MVLRKLISAGQVPDMSAELLLPSPWSLTDSAWVGDIL